MQFNGAPMFAPKGYMTDYLTDEAVKAIKANRNRPFFIYFAPNAIHTPLQAKKADYDALPQIKDHRLRVYGAMVRTLDRNVGRILQALKDEGLDENTLVIFTSDNGGAGYIGLPDVNKPYRGWKSTFFEGGIHAPFFMRWPGMIPAGLALSAIPSATSTSSPPPPAAAGAQVPTDRTIDGVDLLPFLQGKAPGRPHQTLFWRSGQYKAVLDGDWKLQSSEAAEQGLALRPGHRPHRAARPLRRPSRTQAAALLALLAAQDARASSRCGRRCCRARCSSTTPAAAPQKAGDEYITLGQLSRCRFLPPRPTRQYRGARSAAWFLALAAVLTLGPGLIHSFLPDGGARVIAGLDLGDRRDLVIGVFAWEGATQLALGLGMLAVALRYRPLTPLFLALVIVERGLMSLQGWVLKPPANGHHPPEHYASPVIVVLAPGLPGVRCGAGDLEAALLLIALALRSDARASPRRVPGRPAWPRPRRRRPGMVLVKGGRFTHGRGAACGRRKARRATDQVGSFWMDRTEVTNAHFARFVDATGYVTVAERPPTQRTIRGLSPAAS